MISLKKREQISAGSVTAAASTASERAGFAFVGIFLLALFILSFCCRFAQASLLYGIQLAGPGSEWDAPSALLLLVPVLLAALPAGYLAGQSNNYPSFALAAGLGCVLTTINMLSGFRVAPVLVLSFGTVLVSIGLELARVNILAQVSSTVPNRFSKTTSINLVFVELAATALAAMLFKTQAQFLTLSVALRVIALALLASSFLIYLLKRTRGYIDNSASIIDESPRTGDVRSQVSARFGNIKVRATATGVVAAAANITLATLFCLTIAQRSVALQPVFTYWSYAAIGAVAGSLFCMWPGRREESNNYLTLVISAVSALLCAWKPEGYALIIGLILCGFASSMANINCCNKIIKWRQVMPPGLLFAAQSLLCGAASLLVLVMLEPKIESISAFVFIRAISLAQLSFLLIAGAVCYTQSQILKSRTQQPVSSTN